MLVDDLEVVHSPLRNSEESSLVISGNKLSWDAGHFLGKIALRPDVKEDAILGLVDQVLLSLGGITQKSIRGASSASSSGAGGTGTYVASALPTITANNMSGEGWWTQIKIIFGADSRYLRIAVLHVTPTSSLGSMLSANSTHFCDFTDKLASHLCRALSEEHWTLSHLDAMCQEQAESVLDLPFVMDLISVAADEMNRRIAENVETVDEVVRSAESQCARLMTLLKPTYQRAGLALPPLPTPKSVNAYTLTLSRPSLREACTAEQARMLLLMSRKAFRQQQLEQTDGELAASVAQQVAALAATICKELEDWADEEGGTRMKRKLQQVKDRLTALNAFRMQLLLTLHDRFRTPAASVGTGGLFSSWMGGGHSADKKHHAQALEIFPFLGDDEPVLFDGAVSLPLQGFKGALFVTLGHVMFHGSVGLMRSPVVKVWPFKALSRVVLLSPQTAGKEKESLSEIQHGGLEGVLLVDAAGEESVVVVADITPHMHLHLFDLLNLIFREKLHTLLDSKQRQAAVPANAFEQPLPVERTKTSGEASSSIPTATTPVRVKQDRDMAELLRELEGLDDVEGALNVITFRSPQPTTAVPVPQPVPSPQPSPPIAPISAVDTTAVAVPSVVPTDTKKKTMGANIQKFLQQQQASAKKVPLSEPGANSIV